MLTQEHTLQHCKCINILDLIKRSNNNLMDAEWQLNTYRKSDQFSAVRLFTNESQLVKRIEFTKAVRDRLITYYANNLVRLIEPAAKKAFFHIVNNN